MPDLRAYVQETLTCEATAVALGSGEATALPLPQRIRFFSPCRAGSASSGQAEEETMGKIWCEEDDPTRDGKEDLVQSCLLLREGGKRPRRACRAGEPRCGVRTRLGLA